jgi:hypothetical protein
MDGMLETYPKTFLGRGVVRWPNRKPENNAIFLNDGFVRDVLKGGSDSVPSLEILIISKQKFH